MLAEVAAGQPYRQQLGHTPLPGYLAQQRSDLGYRFGVPAAERALADTGPERAVSEQLAAATALAVPGHVAEQVDQLANVREARYFAEDALQHGAAGAARSGDVDDRGRAVRRLRRACRSRCALIRCGGAVAGGPGRGGFRHLGQGRAAVVHAEISPATVNTLVTADCPFCPQESYVLSG